MRKINLFLIICLCIPTFFSNSFGQQPGDKVLLSSTNQQGVPVHPEAGNNQYVRWENGTIATIEQIDSRTGWFKVTVLNRSGWVTKKYITVIPDEDDGEQPEGTEIPSYVVGTWNLEHFRSGAQRGFPEYNYGGPKYPARTNEDMQYIAQVIENQLLARLLVLCEIGGNQDGHSPELERLITFLGTEWTYQLGSTGGSQRIAFLYDSTNFKQKKYFEIEVAKRRVQDADIFYRDPVACLFSCLDNDGNERNDFIVIGIHLASGQGKNTNHNEAMKILKERLKNALNDETFPNGENDVLIMGDFNANRYDSSQENFWTGYDENALSFVTLSPEDGEEYSGTRLAGVPLFPKSKIDYILASGTSNGMTNSLVQLLGHVHTELLTIGFDEFRKRASDHLPVTVRIRVSDDDD